MSRLFPHPLPPALRRCLTAAVLTATAVTTASAALAASDDAAEVAPLSPLRPLPNPESSRAAGGQENSGGASDERLSPPLECYRAARRTLALRDAETVPGDDVEGSRAGGPVAARQGAPAMRPSVSAPAGGTDPAYVCDLAVQVARDSGSARALAAALSNRSLVLAAEGRLEPALADLDSAVQLTPEDPVVHGNRGNLLLRLGRPADALAAHGRAVDLDPDDPGTYYNRAFSYRAVGDPVRAEQDVAAARSLLQRQRLPFMNPGAREPADR